jgi:death-on-curing protein
LSRLYVELPDEIDVWRLESATTHILVRYVAALSTYFNILAITDIGGRSGPVRAPGLVEPVVAASFQTYGNHDPHPTPFDKAAMLLRGITQGHPFVDGNKRTGFAVASYVLEMTGYPMPPALAVDETIDLCVRVSAGTLRDVEAIASELRRLWGVD